MSVPFIHTADWQLGRPYARVEDPEKRSLLRQARMAVIERIGEVAEENGAAFILVAGDLFDSATVSRAIVSQACSAIGQLKIPVLVIPGNHDHGGPGGIWEQEFFKREQEALAPNLRVLLTAEPVELEKAVIWPCPLLRRHESSDPTAWLHAMDEGSLERFGNKPRIVLAHGSVQSFSSEDADDEDGGTGMPNLIDLGRLPAGIFDYVALGDWHGTAKVATNAWYSGTPELDRFPKGSGHDPGNVLLVKAARASLPDISPIHTSRLRWQRLEFTFSEDEDLERLEERVTEVTGNRAGQDVLHLTLRGSLGLNACDLLEKRLDTWRARFLRLKLENQVVMAPGEDEIEALTHRSQDPLISRIASRLVEGDVGEGADEAVIQHALRELHSVVTAASSH